MPGSRARVTTRAPLASAARGLARKVSKAGPIQKISFARRKMRAMEGLRAKSWGEAAPSTMRTGAPAPSMTPATREWTGLMLTATSPPEAGEAAEIRAANRAPARKFQGMEVSGMVAWT